MVAHPAWHISFAGIQYPQPVLLPPQRGREVLYDVHPGRDWPWAIGMLGGWPLVGLDIVC